MNMERLKYSIKRDLENLKALPPKKRWGFIWEYYKMTICVCVLIILFLAVGLITLSSNRQSDLYVVLINSMEGNPAVFSEQMQKGSKKEAEKIDVERYTLDLSGSNSADATTIQVLAALFSMGNMDVFVSDPEVFERYASEGGFVDLSTWIDTENWTHSTNTLHYTEVNGKSIPIGIELSADSLLHQSGYYEGTAIIGVVANAVHLDAALVLLKQIGKQ